MIRKPFHVSPTETHTSGPLAGEPVRERRRKSLGPVRKDAPVPMARVAIARARAMGKTPPEWAVKFIEAEEGTNHLPSDGVPKPPTPKTGSIIPEIVASRLIPDTQDEWKGLVQNGEVVDPPFNPWLLVSTALESGILPPSIEAMATNISGFGFELEPLFPTEDPETGARLDPPPEAEEERGDILLFLASANLDAGLQGLMFVVDQDIEETGNGYLEVLRNRGGDVAALEHAPSYTMRLGKLSVPVLTEAPVRHPVSGELVSVPRYRRFRTFVQIREQRVIYFKQFGDPRFINRRTGEYSETTWGTDRLGTALDGTEIQHFRIYASWTPYGIPRWLGALPQVRAERYTGELLADWFDNAPIGAKVALVAGGAWSQESLDRALGQIDDMARGIDNAWSIITLEAESTSMADPVDGQQEQRPQIMIDDLAVNLPEALYSGDSSLWRTTRDHVATMFRLPPLYYGRSDDYTRATSATARSNTEEQVFVPIRDRRWGSWMNLQLFPGMGVNFWRVRLRGANTTDDSDIPLAELGENGGASPNSMIRLANEITGQDRDLITEPWADRPLALTLELIKLKVNPNLPLEEALAEIQKREEEAKAEAAAQLAELNGKGDTDTEDKPKGPPASVKKALAIVAEVSDLRRTLEAQIEADAGGWYA